MTRERVKARATMADVARRAGVSIATVSYVVNGTRGKGTPTRISAETSERVRAAMEEVQYAVNTSARTLRRRRTDRVLLLMGRLTSPFSQSIAQEIERALLEQGLSLDVHLTSGIRDIERAIDLLDKNLADGLIIETGDGALPTLRVAADRGHAIVAVGTSTPDDLFDTVVYEDALAIDESMQRLVQRRAHHYILYALPGDGGPDARATRAHAALIQSGVPASAISIRFLPHDRELAYRDALALLPEREGPVAMYAGSDVSAIGILWACLHLGLTVPDDVAIVGHGNIAEGQIAFPPLTTLGPVSWDPSVAARFMASRLKDRSLPGRDIRLPWHLVARQSA